MLPMLEDLSVHSDFNLNIIACEQHCMSAFGHTIDNINFPISLQINPKSVADSPMGRMARMAQIQEDLVQYLMYSNTDYLMVYGDRAEALAGAIAALHTNTKLIHLQAGDETGTHDDTHRRMIHQTADVLFCASTEHADNLAEQGIVDNVYVVGDQHLDPYAISRDGPIPMSHPEGDYVVLLMHPDPSDPDSHMKAMNTMQATNLLLMKYPSLEVHAIYPCSDPGCVEIIAALHKLENNRFHVHKNIPGKEFQEFLRFAILLIGNSSAGIIEAPFVGAPAINIGNRQHNRMSSPSTINLSGFVESTIYELAYDIIERNIPLEFENLYGDGTAYKQIIKVLERL